MHWYELNLKDRYEQFYSKHSIEDFYAWWSDNNQDYMELRFDDWRPAKNCAQRFNLHYNKASVFTNNPIIIKQILQIYSKRHTVWFGVNPRRMLRNRTGQLKFSGLDVNVSQLKYLFIDIDRKVKKGIATNQDLMDCDFVANMIIEMLNKENMCNNYLKICSANGVQLLIKLDVPFNMPLPEYHEEGQIYIENELFLNIKHKIKNGIGKVLKTFFDKFSNQKAKEGIEYNAELDTCFNLGRVAALPYSYNLKNNQALIRGIVELKQGMNNGLTDYIEQLSTDITQVQTKRKEYSKNSLVFSKEYNIKQNEMQNNILVELLLNHKFPDGGINNTLWYALKIILHRMGISCTDSEYLKVHQLMRKLHDRGFSDNGLEPHFRNNYNGPIKEESISFVPFMVNKYLRLHKIQRLKDMQTGYHKPIFPVSPNGKKEHDIKINIVPSVLKESYQSDAVYVNDFRFDDTLSDPLEHLQKYTKHLQNIRNGYYLDDHFKDDNNAMSKVIIQYQLNESFKSFMQQYLKYWGTEISVYMMKYYMPDYLNFNRFH